MPQQPLNFDGKTFNRRLDGKRLANQFIRVRDLMLDGQWHTLQEIQRIVGGSESGVGARVRDLRKERFGGYQVERRRAAKGGTWEYRIGMGVMQCTR